MTLSYKFISFVGTAAKACIMDWTLGSSLRPENHPAPAPVIYITGKTFDNAEDVEHLGMMLADSFFKGKVADFRGVIKNVNLKFVADEALRETSKMARLHTMLANMTTLDVGGGLDKGATFVFTMPDLVPEENDLFMFCCKEFADKRGSTLLHLEVETAWLGDTPTLGLNFAAVGYVNRSIDLLLYPHDPLDTTTNKIHDTLCTYTSFGISCSLRDSERRKILTCTFFKTGGLVSVKERVHLIKGDFLPFNERFRPEVHQRMTINEVCRADNTEQVQFLCLIETKPLWKPDEGLLTMRICDRTASVSIVFRGVDEKSIDLPFLLNLEPGSPRQLACDVVRSPVRHDQPMFTTIHAITSSSRDVGPSTKGFFKSARASMKEKFRYFRK